MAFFTDSLDDINTDSHQTESTRSFEDEDAFSNYVESNGNGDDIFGSNGSTSTEDNAVFFESNGPILPPPSEMHEEGFALREWRRLNAIQLEEKEKREKEILRQIIEEATEYKVAFHEKRKVTCENNKTNNREKEKLFLDIHEKFHKEADKNYWKTIADLIPNEVPTIEKKRGKKKDDEKKPSITVIQGPKPGKPTDLSRMRQIFVKLKHKTPSHLNLASSPKVGNANGPTTEPLKTAPETVVTA